MITRISNWFTGGKSQAPRATKAARRAALQVESLEQRLVLSTTDMTTLAQWYGPARTEATTLYLNFDGGDINWNMAGYQGSKSIQPYAPAAGHARDRDIQTILSEVGKMFAPFNVKVKQLTGAGNFDGSNGNTTVFVGGDATNVTDGVKTDAAGTPGEFTDNPGTTLGYLHAPDSEPFHLAFVDPMKADTKGGAWYNAETNDYIAESVGHEAGHTFGLEHTLTGGVTDLMSYDSDNVTFVNQTFPVTDLNSTLDNGTINAGDSMYAKAYHPTLANPWGLDLFATATQQNSYTYLQAVLGANPHQMKGKVPTIHANVGWQFQGTVATFSDANAANAADSYTAIITWGDGHTSTGQVHSNHNGTFRVVGTNTYEALPSGSSKYAVNVTITDANGYTLYLTGWAKVTRAGNDLTGYGYTNTSTAGQGRNFAVATFSDPDGHGQASDYQVVIHWGDGSVSTGQVSRNQDGTFLVSGWNNYYGSGTYTVTIDITDASGTLTLTSTVDVVSAPLKSWSPRSNTHEV
jgi:hypothetical protein